MPSWLSLLHLIAVLGVASSLPAGDPAALPRSPRLTGTPFLSVWRAEDYGASPINWRVLQHPQTGFIYFANNLGVLEFDGAAWRLIRLPRRSAVRALALDNRGTLWAGGVGELCTLEPDPLTGELRPVDQAPRVPPHPEAIGNDAEPAGSDEAASNDPHRLGVVDRMVAATDGVYVSLPGRVVRFGAEGRVHAWPEGRKAAELIGLFALEGEAHLNRPSIGVQRVRGDQLELAVPGLTPSIFTVQREPAGTDHGSPPVPTWTLLTREGTMQWRGPGTSWSKPDPRQSELLMAETARCGEFLPDGRVVYGTARSGLLIYDAAGRLVQRIDRRHGLPADRVNAVCVDRDGGLWVAMHFAVARVQIDSPFAIHGAGLGLEGGPRDLFRAGDRLTVTHGEGFAWRDDRDGHFHPVSGFRTGTHHAALIGGKLVATGTGIYEVPREGPARLLRPALHYALLEPRDPAGALLVSTTTQLTLWPSLERGDDRVRLDAIPTGANRLLQTPDGFIWAVLRSDEIWRIDARGGLRADSPARRFVPDGNIPPARRSEGLTILTVGPDLIAASARWLLRYDAAADKFVPETRAGLRGAERGPAAACAAADGSAWLYFAGADARLVRIRADPSGGWSAERFPAQPLGDLALNALYHDGPTRTLWLAGQGALVSFTPDTRPEIPPVPLRAVVHHVADGSGRILRAPRATHTATPLTLEPAQNALRFAFGAPVFAPDYRGQIGTMFRTRLEGLEGEWTPWSTESRRDFTNLPPGNLKFRVQARDLAGRVSEEATLGLVLAPPWWRTPWAFAGYAAGAVTLMSGVVTLRTRALRRRAERLEGIVADRTQELQARNVELARLHKLELDEKIAARLAAEKAQLEVLRYQLNPHFLFNALNSIYGMVYPHSRPAGDLVRRLSEFCRTTLARTEHDWRPLGQEIAMLRAYLDIEQSRWRDRLRVTVSLDPAAESVALPAFLLLPLVENAIKHGGATSADVLTIRLATARIDASTIEIEVANSGAWRPVEREREDRSPGIGMENSRARLARCFPDAHTVTIEEKDGWVVVRLRISDCRSPKASDEGREPHRRPSAGANRQS